MSVKELIKDRGYEMYPQDSSIIVKLEVYIDEHNRVNCKIKHHQIVDKVDTGDVQSSLYKTLTHEEVEHLKQQVQRLKIISKE